MEIKLYTVIEVKAGTYLRGWTATKWWGDAMAELVWALIKLEKVKKNYTT